ncbi:MAG: formate/nitrite transporter family protein [Clostridiales bacterium]|jgi:formate/nitrite transporter|nr:formate/nitrite transporter family protein [Clostridiales bacterium]
MNMLTPREITEAYARIGKAKSVQSTGKLAIMGILAGLFIAFGAAASSTASHSIDNVSLARLISGLVFPFGLGMVMLTGAELFTGNTMIAISVLSKETTAKLMLRNWLIVYLANFVGALALAMGCAWFGQLDYSSGGLALFAIKTAASKTALPFQNALVAGIFCNILVCAGVLCSLSAKDTIGRIAGAYIPVAFFVICGFEHSVANMYYVPAGIFALQVPKYAQLVASAGISTQSLTWANFFFRNLIPVTLGNIIGGAGIGAAMWACHMRNQPKAG